MVTLSGSKLTYKIGSLLKFILYIYAHTATYPGVNCEEAMRPGLRPAAAAMAAMLALVGSWAAPCSAADKLGAATITCPVPSVLAREDGAWVTVGVDS